MFQREASKREWATVDYHIATDREVNSGSLQRIADACELMAKSYRELIEERERYRLWWKDEQNRRHHLERVIRGLKSRITVLEKKK